jgi:hypothetical protein
MEKKEERPAYVRFEKRAVEDRTATINEGHYMAKDEIFVLITPPGSKDEIPRLVADWLKQLDQQVKEDRISAGLVDRYKQAYERWLKGEEIPLHGTAIKGWPLSSPAEQQMVLAANIRTVEDLAQANGEAIARIGMKGYELKQKAEAWLKAATDHGKLAGENVALKTKVSMLEQQLAGLEKKMAEVIAAQSAKTAAHA